MTYGFPFRYAFKSGFNTPAKVLTWWAMENNISSAAKWSTVDTWKAVDIN